MLPLAYWVHNLKPFVPYLQFSETIGVRWYGLAYVLGFVGGAWLIQRAAKAGRSQLPAEKTWDLIIVLVAGVMIGGRLGSFVFYHPSDLIHDPLSFFRVWEGGMASHGGFIGLAVAIGLYARSQRLSFFHLADVVVSAGPLGLLFGRIANFINGELWGKITDVPWAVIFPLSASPGTPTDLIQPRHPSQLYEAALEGALMLAYVQWRFWRSDIARVTPGRLTGEFVIGYALVRIIGEIFREPDWDVTPIMGLSRGTFYSIFMLIVGITLILLSLRARKTVPKPLDQPK
jgi:phosphatidylglycerol:prolipoprotein diacylglycerol transferase